MSKLLLVLLLVLFVVHSQASFATLISALNKASTALKFAAKAKPSLKPQVEKLSAFIATFSGKDPCEAHPKTPTGCTDDPNCVFCKGATAADNKCMSALTVDSNGKEKKAPSTCISGRKAQDNASPGEIRSFLRKSARAFLVGAAKKDKNKKACEAEILAQVEKGASSADLVGTVDNAIFKTVETEAKNLLTKFSSDRAAFTAAFAKVSKSIAADAANATIEAGLGLTRVRSVIQQAAKNRGAIKAIDRYRAYLAVKVAMKLKLARALARATVAKIYLSFKHVLLQYEYAKAKVRYLIIRSVFAILKSRGVDLSSYKSIIKVMLVPLRGHLVRACTRFKDGAQFSIAANAKILRISAKIAQIGVTKTEAAFQAARKDAAAIKKKFLADLKDANKKAQIKDAIVEYVDELSSVDISPVEGEKNFVVLGITFVAPINAAKKTEVKAIIEKMMSALMLLREGAPDDFSFNPDKVTTKAVTTTKKRGLLNTNTETEVKFTAVSGTSTELADGSAAKYTNDPNFVTSGTPTPGAPPSPATKNVVSFLMLVLGLVVLFL